MSEPHREGILMSILGKIILSLCTVGVLNNLFITKIWVANATSRLNIPRHIAYKYTEKLGIYLLD